MEDPKHIVYILKCKDGTLYTGYIVDLRRRKQMHVCGKRAKYTRGRGPFQVVYVERHSKRNIGLNNCHEEVSNNSFEINWKK